MLVTYKVLLISDDKKLKDGLSTKPDSAQKYSFDFQAQWQKGLDKYKEGNFDVVVIEAALAGEALEEMVGALKKIDRDCVVIAVLKNDAEGLLHRSQPLGIYDIVFEPVNMDKLVFLIEKGAQMHAAAFANHKLILGLKEHNLTLEKQNVLLAKRIEDSTKNLTRLYEDLHSTYLRTVKVLAQAIDARDHYTHSHSENVARYATVIAGEMGLSAKDIEVLREACELHDLGKIGIEDNILGKAGALSKEEWEQIKRHPVMGAQILEPLTFLNDVTALVRQHHENYDGTGYPEGRKGEDILLGARIIHLADAYESMRSARSYRKVPLSRDEAVAEIKKNSGTQFDPQVAKAFLNIVDKL